MDPVNPASGGAASGGITNEQLNAAIAEALKPVVAAIAPLVGTVSELAKNQKVLADTFTTQQSAGGDAGQKGQANANAPKYLTMEELTKALDARDTARQQTAQQSQQRNEFISTRLKNLPPVYQATLGNDPAKWEEQAAAIATQFKADTEKLGLKPGNVGGESAGGQSSGAAVPDLSKMSPMQLVSMGLKESKPVGAPAATAAAS